VSTVAGEQEFVRINDGVQVYGTEAERAASDAEFFESVRRGDCRTGVYQIGDYKPADDRSSAVASLDSTVASDLASLDVRTSDDAVSPAAATDDAGFDASAACVDVSSL